jgi:carbon storage regulator
MLTSESGFPEAAYACGTGCTGSGVMLVLSRKKNESIIVDDAIVITVVEIRGDKVRLGIEAPKEVPIHRSEIYAAIQAQMIADSERQASAAAIPPTVEAGLPEASEAPVKQSR